VPDDDDAAALAHRARVGQIAPDAGDDRPGPLAGNSSPDQAAEPRCASRQVQRSGPTLCAWRGFAIPRIFTARNAFLVRLRAPDCHDEPAAVKAQVRDVEPGDFALPRRAGEREEQDRAGRAAL
jgi:hypothetical protein